MNDTVIALTIVLIVTSLALYLSIATKGFTDWSNF